MDKNTLSERDICTKFITPAVKNAGWDELSQIREEVGFPKGRIIVRGKLVTRGKAITLGQAELGRESKHSQAIRCVGSMEGAEASGGGAGYLPAQDHLGDNLHDR